MDLSSFLPPSDLLEKVRGVEAGLRQRKRLTGGGAIVSLLVSTFYLVAIIDKNVKDWQDLFHKTFTEPGLLLPALIVIFCLLFMTWSAFWLRESRQPFRYTCSIGGFEAASAGAPEQVEKWMTWMPYDMTRLLNERVQRFFFAGEPQKGESAPKTTDGVEPDIHIRAHWLVRQVKDSASGALEVEVIPRVRLRSAGNSEVMAEQATVFPLNAVHTRAEYDELLEQVYHGVVTEVYRQLEEDVRTKIGLLPTARYRAIALLYEADDYARSNSLHAYEEAEKLYRDAAALADPQWDVPLQTKVPRLLRWLRRALYESRSALRWVEAHYRPSVQALDLLGARALSGSARMLVFKQLLRGIVGKATGAAFEAPSIASMAVRRIELLSRDVPGYADALFEAYVTLCLARWSLGDFRGAEAALDTARQVHPGRANDDAAFILASGMIAPEPRTRLAFLRRSVERAPRFEVAQFWLAHEYEVLWRSRERFESKLAKMVFEEYEKLLKLNPANVGGCANAGYVSWLLNDSAKARKYFEQGLRFTRTRKDLFACELDYGLARIDAESGAFINAYRHYLGAVSVLSLGFQGGDFRPYYFQPMSDDTERRFRRYYLRVRAHVRAIDPADEERVRLGNSIHAFAANDLGEAYAHGAGVYWTFDEGRRCRAIRVLKRAIRTNDKFLLPYATLFSLDHDNKRKHEHLERGLALEPAWPQGALALAQYHASEIPDVRGIVKKVRQTRAKRDKLQKAMRRRHLRWWRPGPSVARRREWVQKVETKITQLEKELEKGRTKAEKHRKTALQHIRKVLPHQWLWAGDELSFTAIIAGAASRDRRLIRDLSILNADALYTGVRCSLYAEKRVGHTIRVLEQILQFWPGTPYVLADLLEVRRARVGEAWQRTLVESVLEANPAAILDLVERGITVTKQQFLDCDAEAYRIKGHYRELRDMPFRRKECYLRMAMECETLDEVKDIFDAAEKRFKDGWGHFELARYLRQRAVAEKSMPLLSEARDAAGQAVDRAPGNRQYARELADLKWRQKIGIAAALLERPARFAIECAEDLSPGELRQSCKDLRPQLYQDFGFWFPLPTVRKDAHLGARQCRIIIDGRGVDTVTLENPVKASCSQELQRVLVRNSMSFLRFDDVLMLLNTRAGLGDRLRADGVLPEVTRVLRALLHDGVSLYPIDPIVNAFRAAWRPGRTLTAVVEEVRSHPDVRPRLSSVLPEGRIRKVVRIGSSFEDIVQDGLRAGGGAILALDPKITDRLRQSIRDLFAGTSSTEDPVIVTTPELRPWVKKIAENSVERLVVASNQQRFAEESYHFIGIAEYRSNA